MPSNNSWHLLWTLKLVGLFFKRVRTVWRLSAKTLRVRFYYNGPKTVVIRQLPGKFLYFQPSFDTTDFPSWSFFFLVWQRPPESVSIYHQHPFRDTTSKDWVPVLNHYESTHRIKYTQIVSSYYVLYFNPLKTHHEWVWSWFPCFNFNLHLIFQWFGLFHPSHFRQPEVSFDMFLIKCVLRVPSTLILTKWNVAWRNRSKGPPHRHTSSESRVNSFLRTRRTISWPNQLPNRVRWSWI